MVVVRLVLVRLSKVFPAYRAWFIRGDAIAALVVVSIVIWVSLKLRRRPVEALLDRALVGLEEQARHAVAGVEHVRECGPIRLQTAGPVTFAEVTVRVAPEMPTAIAHEMATRVEKAVCRICPNCDVTVHIEPAASSDGYHVYLGLEIPQGLSLE